MARKTVEGAQVLRLTEGLPGYASDARVATSCGPRPIRDLRAGDLLLTRDRGFAPLLVAMPLRGRQPCLTVGPDALGPGMPRTMVQLAPSVRVVNMRGAAEGAHMLCALPGLPDVCNSDPVEMSVLLFETQAEVLVNGAWVHCPVPCAKVIAAVLPHLSDDNRQVLAASFAHLPVAGALAGRKPAVEDMPDPGAASQRSGYLH